MTTTTATATDAILALKFLQSFICPEQMIVLTQMIDGEEKEFFVEKLVELAERIKGMPKTYETDGLGLEAVAYLHYFKNGFDWYMTEKDMEPEQLQAFGLVKMFEEEYGYISIEELKAAGVEIDLYFSPTALKELK